MLKEVSAYVEKHHMLSEGDTIVTGVSGGADSVCLLLVLSALQKEIPFTLLAVHVNHLIRPEAGKDEAFVKILCEKLKVPFFSVKEDVKEIARARGLSTEEAGRQIRYEAFWQILQKEAAQAVRLGRAKIAVAHNLNDRAETMLFHLFRGSGLSGLCSIRPVRKSKDKPDIIRPLLGVKRVDIEKFLTGMDMKWCIDHTNEEDTYTRNRIRHHILPYAEEQVAKGAVSNMGRAADILLEAEDFMRQETEKAYKNCLAFDGQGIGLFVDRVSEYHPFLQKQTILFCLEKLILGKKNVTAMHAEEVVSLFSQSGNRKLSLPYGITVRREYDTVLFEKEEEAAQKISSEVLFIELPLPDEKESCVSLSSGQIMEFKAFTYEKTINIPQNEYTKWFDYDKIKKPLAVRTRQAGDYLMLKESGFRKSIQDYMVDEKIPRTKREEIMLLTEGAHVLWVVGRRISSYYKINENTKYILQVQLRGGR